MINDRTFKSLVSIETLLGYIDKKCDLNITKIYPLNFVRLEI